MPSSLKQPVPIIGLGTALPPNTIAQSQAIELSKKYCCSTIRQEQIISELHRRTGIHSRATVLASDVQEQQATFFSRPVDPTDSGPTTAHRMLRYSQEVVPLARCAAEAALQNAQVKSSEITHLITVSCTGFFAPGLDIALIKQLGLPLNVGRTQVGFMGCHGALNGLRLALAIAGADPSARILLCAAELCSIHFQYGWNSHNLIANSLFGDGAAAMVIGHGKGSKWRVLDVGSQLLLDSEDAMSWTIGDHGFTMTLSSQVPDLISQNLADWIKSWLEDHQLSVQDINSWAVHPGGPRILDAVQNCLMLSDSALASSRQILNDYGNMSSPTLLFILQHLQQQGATAPCVLLGFGPGLMIEAALLV